MLVKQSKKLEKRQTVGQKSTSWSKNQKRLEQRQTVGQKLGKVGQQSDKVCQQIKKLVNKSNKF